MKLQRRLRHAVRVMQASMSRFGRHITEYEPSTLLPSTAPSGGSPSAISLDQNRRTPGTTENRQGSVLLTCGAYYGTLAAARFFGRQGLEVTLADGQRNTPTRFSRYVAQTLECPGRLEFSALRDWLVEYGKNHPGTLLYPCSDDHAWLIASHRDELSQWFRMYQPSLTTIEGLLNKEKLYTTCKRLEIPIPETYFPRNDRHLDEVASALSGAYLVKPKTQVGMRINKKAEVFVAGTPLAQGYRSFQQDFRYNEVVIDHDPSLGWPMVQRFRPEASKATISVAGFIDRRAGIFTARCSQKVLQYPINIGVGLCFAGIEAPPELVERVRRICDEVGYFGVFEAEFIRVETAEGDEYLLMDFNPRFYGQMEFEISRGVALPGLVDACSRGDYAAAKLMAETSLGNRQMNMRFANSWLLKLVMTTQWAGRRVSWAGRGYWLRWVGDRRGVKVDQVHAADDILPFVADVVLRFAHYVRYPRSSLRTLFGTS